MNLILLSEKDFIGPAGKVRLEGRRHKHILEVLKASVGDELCVGLTGGKIGRGRITAIDDHTVDMDISLESGPPAPIPIMLVLALPRPIVLKRILSHVTALGIKRIVLMHTDRVEKSYWKSPVLNIENIRSQLILGLEQAKDTIMPEISLKTDFRSFVEDELPSLIKGTRAFVVHPEGERSLPARSASPTTLIIGPEGGFIPREIEQFKSAGCIPVHLGKRILRVETAVIASISRLAE